MSKKVLKLLAVLSVVFASCSEETEQKISIPETQKNKVTIFNRWGSKVFEVSNYNNTTNVFRGLNNEGTELPTGTYFFKIEFDSGRNMETGYLTLKR